MATATATKTLIQTVTVTATSIATSCSTQSSTCSGRCYSKWDDALYYTVSWLTGVVWGCFMCWINGLDKQRRQKAAERDEEQRPAVVVNQAATRTQATEPPPVINLAAARTTPATYPPPDYRPPTTAPPSFVEQQQSGTPQEDIPLEDIVAQSNDADRVHAHSGAWHSSDRLSEEAYIVGDADLFDELEQSTRRPEESEEGEGLGKTKTTYQGPITDTLRQAQTDIKQVQNNLCDCRQRSNPGDWQSYVEAVEHHLRSANDRLERIVSYYVNEESDERPVQMPEEEEHVW